MVRITPPRATAGRSGPDLGRRRFRLQQSFGRLGGRPECSRRSSHKSVWRRHADEVVLGRKRGLDAADAAASNHFTGFADLPGLGSAGFPGFGFAELPAFPGLAGFPEFGFGFPWFPGLPGFGFP